MRPDYEKLFSTFFKEAADLASTIALKYFRTQTIVDEKPDKSPVTQADREIELLLRNLISKRFPHHGIIGEEFGNTDEDAEFVWVLDPIDGTRAFMTGKPLFGTLIGLMHESKPVVGLIDQPFTKERWFGIDGYTTWYNETPIRVAPTRKLEEARLYTGAPYMFYGEFFDNYLDLCNKVKWPQFGCDCYAYGLLAMGFADLVVERDLKIHDVAAIAPIITGAGGFISDWNLKSTNANFDGTCIAASSRELAEKAADLIRSRV